MEALNQNPCTVCGKRPAPTSLTLPGVRFVRQGYDFVGFDGQVCARCLKRIVTPWKKAIHPADKAKPETTWKAVIALGDAIPGHLVEVTE